MQDVPWGRLAPVQSERTKCAKCINKGVLQLRPLALRLVLVAAEAVVLREYFKRPELRDHPAPRQALETARVAIPGTHVSMGSREPHFLEMPRSVAAVYQAQWSEVITLFIE